VGHHGSARSETRKFRFQRGTDIDDAIHQLRTSGEVVFLRDTVRLQARGEMLRHIQVTTGHPARRFHGLCSDVMIGVFFIVAAGIVAENGIDLEQAK
jgi:hypothetical protein